VYRSATHWIIVWAILPQAAEANSCRDTGSDGKKKNKKNDNENNNILGCSSGYSSSMTKRRSSERITQQQNRPCVNRYSDGCEFDRCTWWQHGDDDGNNINNNNRNKMRHTTTTTTWRVFYGCILNAIGTWLWNWGDQGLPSHDIAVERRHPKSATSSTWHQIDYSSATMTINSRWAPQSSSMHICQTQMSHD
jgi:hypothetical protein